MNSVKAASQFIMMYTYPGDVVLDVGSGVGTVAVTAAFLGRRGVGIESDEKAINGARRFLYEVTKVKKNYSEILSNLPNTVIAKDLWMKMLKERHILSVVSVALEARLKVKNHTECLDMQLQVLRDLQLTWFKEFGSMVLQYLHDTCNFPPSSMSNEEFVRILTFGKADSPPKAAFVEGKPLRRMDFDDIDTARRSQHKLNSLIQSFAFRADYLTLGKLTFYSC